MQCTPEEIEAKRREAQMKLTRKKLINEINQHNCALVHNTSNLNSDPRVHNFSASVSNSAFKNENTPEKNYGNVNTWRSPHASRNLSKPYEKPKQTQTFYGKGNTVTGTCYLISENRFAVELSAFSTQAIEVFKTVPSRSYNAKTRIWDFDIKDYDFLHQKLALLQPDVVVGKLPHFVINCCKLGKPDYSKIDLSKIDQELKSALMPFQEEGVCFGIDKNGRCLIADDMGLGKTFQALAIASYYRSDWPLLIITTSSMKNTWEETIHRYMPSVSLMETQYMVSSKDYIGDAKILIVSHDLMSRTVDKLIERKFGVIIIDESHTLKNFKAKCTKAATELSRRAQRVILLSGTPALSRPSELYTQLAMIDEKFFGNFFEYSKRYCDGKTTQFGWDANGNSNLQELEIILSKKFMIRRTKDDVLKTLPERKREVIQLDVHLDQLGEEDRRCLKALASNYNRMKKSGDKQAALLAFFAETSKIKIPSVCSFVLKVLQENKKFIVFAHHQKMLDALQKLLEKKAKRFIRIDGNTTSEQRKYFVDKFQFSDEYICAILSITAANAGITLTAAQLVIFAELHWNPSILSQAESRAHRIGQAGEVVVQYLLASGTADDYIWPLLEEKQKTLKEVGLCRGSFSDVSLKKQNICKNEKLAEGLDFGSSKKDITAYLIKTPYKNSRNSESSKEEENNESSKEEDCAIQPNNASVTSYFRSEDFGDWNICDSFSDGDEKGYEEKKDHSMEMELLNDDFDDVLGNVDITM